MHRRIRHLALALAAVALGVTGCASGPGSLPEAEIVADISCAGSDPLGGGASEGAGVVPQGFEPVAVVRCLPFQTAEDDEGVWSVVARERLEGDLTALLEVQATPNDPRSFGPCAAIATIAPSIWLADAAGRGIRVRYPVDGCGQPKVDLIGDAVDDLVVVHTDEEQRTLAQPRAALDAGCAPTWSARPLQLAPAPEGDDAAREGADAAREGAEAAPAPLPSPSDGSVQAIPWEPPPSPAIGEVDSLIACAYTTDASAAPSPTPEPGATAWATVHTDDMAWFTGARELDAAETTAVLAAVASAGPPPGTCDDLPGSLVVLSADSGAAPITVELDGCRRLIVDYLKTYAAPLELIDLLAG